MFNAAACDRHNLWFAHSPAASRDGTRVYVICSCGKPRAVPLATWQREEARRAQGWQGRACDACNEQDGQHLPGCVNTPHGS